METVIFYYFKVSILVPKEAYSEERVLTKDKRRPHTHTRRCDCSPHWTVRICLPISQLHLRETPRTDIEHCTKEILCNPEWRWTFLHRGVFRQRTKVLQINCLFPFSWFLGGGKSRKTNWSYNLRVRDDHPFFQEALLAKQTKQNKSPGKCFKEEPTGTCSVSCNWKNKDIDISYLHFTNTRTEGVCACIPYANSQIHTLIIFQMSHFDFKIL